MPAICWLMWVKAVSTTYRTPWSEYFASTKSCQTLRPLVGDNNSTRDAIAMSALCLANHTRSASRIGTFM